MLFTKNAQCCIQKSMDMLGGPVQPWSITGSEDVLDGQNLCHPKQNGVQKLFASVTLYDFRKTKFEEN